MDDEEQKALLDARLAEQHQAAAAAGKTGDI